MLRSVRCGSGGGSARWTWPKISGVSPSIVSRIERGKIGDIRSDVLRTVAASLEMELDLLPRWRGADLDRLLNAGHAAMHESLARFFAELEGWQAIPEVSFSIYGERGVIDILAWHAASRTVLVIELKTELVDPQDLVSTMDRRVRLARRIAGERAWDASTVASWVVLAESRTNRRRVERQKAMLRAAFPADGRAIRAWLSQPVGSISALSFWTDPLGVTATPVACQPKRIRPRRAAAA